MHTLLSTLATDDNSEADLVRLSANVVEWVYGNAEYVGSVFGTTNPTRRQLQTYYENAKANWYSVPVEHKNRSVAIEWLKKNNIQGLDYYFPIGYKAIWFKSPEDAFAFKLKFGE